MQSTGKTGGLSEQVLAKAVDLTFRQATYLIGGTIVAATLVTLVLWPLVDSSRLIGWYCVLIAVNLGRAHVARAYFRPNAKPISYWANVSTLSLAASGALWGGASIILFPPGSDPIAQLALLAIVAVLVTYIANLAHGKSYLAFLYCTLVPCIAQSALAGSSQGSRFFGALSIALLCHLVFMTLFACRQNKVFRHNTMVQLQLAESARQLEEKIRETEQSAREKTRFFAAANHDLRQPVHAIGLLIHGLHQCPCVSSCRTQLDQISSAIAIMDNMLNSLMRMACLDSGQVTAHESLFDARELTQNVARRFLPQAQQQGLELSVRQPDMPLPVRTDRSLMTSILDNIVANAIQYTAQGGITISVKQRGKQVVFRIADSGIGIPRNMRKEVFKEFFQLNNVGRNSRRGFGLGLSIVSRLSDLLGARLTLRSRLGVGSCFSIALARDESPAGRALAAASPVEDAWVADRFLTGKRVFIAEDDTLVLDGMSRILSDWGATLYTASTGSDALDVISRSIGMFDFVISDYWLGDGIDGIEVIRTARKSSPTATAILVTGDTSGKAQGDAADIDGLLVLAKPLSPLRLRVVLKNRIQDNARSP